MVESKQSLSLAPAAETTPSASSFETDELSRHQAEFEETRNKERANRARSIALQTVCAIIVTLCCFEFIARLLVVSSHSPRSNNPQFDAKMVVASTPVEDGTTPLVFIGGSYIRACVFAELLSEKLCAQGIDTSPKNLGINRSYIDQHMALLKAAVAQTKSTPIVFYDLRQESFSRRFQTDAKLNESDKFLDSYAGRKYSNGIKTPADRLLLFLEENSYLVRHRNFLRDQLATWVATVSHADRKFEEPLIANEDKYVSPVSKMGTVLNPQIFTADQYEEHYGKDKRHWFYSDWSNAWLDQVKAYCHEHHTPLVLLWLPLCYPQSKRAGEVPYCAKMKDYYEKLADNKEVFFIDMHDIDQDESHFRNETHCNTVGSIFATSYLAQKLTTEPLRSLFGNTSDRKK